MEATAEAPIPTKESTPQPPSFLRRVFRSIFGPPQALNEDSTTAKAGYLKKEWLDGDYQPLEPIKKK